MKIKKSILFIIVFFSMSSACQANTIDSTRYSIEGRWLLKASVSGYRGWFPNSAIPLVIGDFEDVFISPNLINFRLEANYGINKYIENGLSVGFQHYQYLVPFPEDPENYSIYKEGFAPTFGIHFNFHLLPIFIRDKNCRWDLYLMAKYGLCYLPNTEIDDPFYSHVRHEYGVGIGASVYFWKKIGLFTEFSLGQFSFHPFFTESPFNFRIGISYKFKKRTYSHQSSLRQQ